MKTPRTPTKAQIRGWISAASGAKNLTDKTLRKLLRRGETYWEGWHAVGDTLVDRSFVRLLESFEQSLKLIREHTKQRFEPLDLPALFWNANLPGFRSAGP